MGEKISPISEAIFSGTKHEEMEKWRRREDLFSVGLINGINLGLGSDAIVDWVVQIIIFFTALHLFLSMRSVSPLPSPSS